MEKPRKGSRDTSVLAVEKLSPNTLTVSTMVVISQREEVHTILQAHGEGIRLRGISRISGRAYGTVVSLLQSASQKALMIHNKEVKQIETEEVIADEMWSFVEKNRKIV